MWDTTKSALQCIITSVTGFNVNPALIVYLLNSLGSILARRHFRGAHMPYQVQITFASYRVPIYTPGWRAAMWIKSCWRTKVPGIDRNRIHNPLIQSPGFNPIYMYHVTSTTSTIARYICPSARHFIRITPLDSVVWLGTRKDGQDGMCAPVKRWLAGLLPMEWRKCTVSAECGTESNDWGNNTLWSALILIGKDIHYSQKETP